MRRNPGHTFYLFRRDTTLDTMPKGMNGETGVVSFYSILDILCQFLASLIQPSFYHFEFLTDSSSCLNLLF